MNIFESIIGGRESAKSGLKATELLGHLKRLQAEFDNYRKRTEQEKAAMADEIRKKTLFQLLPIYDAFHEGATHKAETESEAAVVEGYRAIEKVFRDTVRELGLEQMDALGAAFNPKHHQAVAMVPPDGSNLEGCVQEVVKEGFLYKGEVLRPAMVVVVQSSLVDAQSNDDGGAQGSGEIPGYGDDDEDTGRHSISTVV